MKFDLLIAQLDEHNEGNILISKKFNVEEIIFLYSKRQEKEMNSLKEYFIQRFPKIKFLKEVIEEGQVERIEEILTKNQDKKTVVSVTGGCRINSLVLLKLAYDRNIECLYADIRSKIIYKLNKEIDIYRTEFDDLELKDIMEASGCNIVEDSCNLCSKEIILKVTDAICRNIPLWHKYKQKLYDGSIFIHTANSIDKMKINLNNLEEEERSLLLKCLNGLKSMKGLNYYESEGLIDVTFLNNYLKSFIFKSGTWLEVAVQQLISEIKEIDEVKNGVMFLWNKDKNIVRNEVDIVAIRDSILICISCKDSNKYNENALNELNVYSEKLGGKDSCKVLVATKEPEKLAVRERAKEMGIHLVIFDGDPNKFKNTIRAFI